MKENYILYHGDCLEKMNEISDKSINMILCDLPFGITARNKWDVIIDPVILWKHYTRVIKDNGAIILFGKQPFTSIMIMSNLPIYRYNMVWRKNLKTGNLNAKKMPMGAYEDLMVFYKKPPTYNPQTIPRTYQVPFGNTKNSKTKNYGLQKEELTCKPKDYLMPDDVIDYEDSDNIRDYELENEMLYIKCVHNSQGKLHSTQKPVELLEYLIKIYSNENEIVLDNTMGSGSTGIACLNLNRKFIGIEKDDNYFEIAKKRIEENSLRLF